MKSDNGCSPGTVQPEYRYLGNFAACEPWAAQGMSMCDYATGAGTVEKTVAELRKLQAGENEEYWT